MTADVIPTAATGANWARWTDGTPDDRPAEMPLAAKPVAKLLTELQGLHLQHRAVIREWNQALDSEHRAAATDVDLYAAALRRGEADPGPITVTANREAVAAAERKKTALAKAMATCERDLRRAVVADAPRWTSELDQHIAETTETARNLLDQLEAAVAERGTLLATRSFVASAGANWKLSPGLLSAGQDPGLLDGLRTALAQT